MANGNGQLGINPFMEHPQNTNVFGTENQDSKFISEGAPYTGYPNVAKSSEVQITFST